MAEEPNYLVHAFRSQYNLIGLGTAIGFALLAGSGLPLLIAAGIQLAVLPLVAGSDRFQRLVKARRLEEQRGERQEKKQAETSEMVRGVLMTAPYRPGRGASSAARFRPGPGRGPSSRERRRALAVRGGR